MTEPVRVGKLHVHQLPSNKDLAVREEVYKCYCNKEFFVEKNESSGFSKEPNKWVELDSSPYAVEYDATVDGKQFIGRADKDTVFDEEVSDGEVAEGEAGRTQEGDSGSTATGSTD